MAQDGHNHGVLDTLRGLVGRTARRDSDEEAQDFLRDKALIGASDVSSSPKVLRSNASSSPEMVSRRQADPKSSLFEPDGSHGHPLPKFPYDHSKITFRPGVPGTASPEERSERFGKIGRRPQACNVFEALRREYPDDKDIISCELSFEVADYYKGQIQKLRNGRNAHQTSQVTPPIITRFEKYRNGTEDSMPYHIAFDAVGYYQDEIQKERIEYLKAAKKAADLKTQQSEKEIEEYLDEFINEDRHGESTTQWSRSRPEYRMEASPKFTESARPTGSVGRQDWSPIIEEIKWAQQKVASLSLRVRLLRAEYQLTKGNWDNTILRVDELLSVAEIRREFELAPTAHYVKGRAHFGRQEWGAASASFETADVISHGLDFQDYFIDEWRQLATNKQNLSD